MNTMLFRKITLHANILCKDKPVTLSFPSLLIVFFCVMRRVFFVSLSLSIMRVICLNQPCCGAAALHGSGEHISKCTGVHKPISRA